MMMMIIIIMIIIIINGWTLAHCPPSSEWGLGGSNGGIMVARKETGHPTLQSRWPRTSVLSNRHFSNVQIVYEILLLRRDKGKNLASKNKCYVYF